jgi:signal transduction histidine kinase
MPQAGRAIRLPTTLPLRAVTGRGLFLLFGFLTVAAAGVVVLVSPRSAAEAAPIGVMVGGFVAGSTMFAGARHHSGQERWSWRVIGAGAMLAAVGVLVVGLLDLVTGEVPAFGPTDLIFMAAYVLVLTGFALMPQLGSAFRSRARVMLDGLIGAGAMATVVWVLFLPGLREHLASGTFWERLAGVAYPILDSVAVVVAMIVTIRRSSWRFDPRVALLGLGMVLQAIGDLTLLDRGVGQSFEAAQPMFIPYLLAQACYLGVGALIAHKPRPREYADRRQPLWPMLAPYGAAAVAAILIVSHLVEAKVDPELLIILILGAGLVVLVVARQAIALREYRNLVEERRRSLVASVSHELRTPLTAMVGFLDLMKDPQARITDQERLELTEVVHQQAQYMSRIVSDLLLLARDSSGLTLREMVTNIEQAVETSLRAVRAGATIDTEIASDLFAYVDPDRLRQVIDNLVSNALRYGSGRVLVTAAGEGSDLVIEVHDNGEGVPRRYEVVIWDQFERGPNRLNSAVPGSGIGLAVVDLVVRRHGGAATYERSARLGGACFRVVFSGRLRPPPGAESAAGVRLHSPVVAS